MLKASADRPDGGPGRPTGLLLVVMIAVLPATLHAAPEAITILANSAVAETSIGFRGTRTVQSFERDQRRAVVRQSVVHAPGGRTRVETLAPAACAGRLAVCDGEIQWEYYPQQKRCVRRVLPGAAEARLHLQRSLERIRKALRPRLVSTEQLLGRRVYRIVVSGPDGRPVRGSWVDAASFVELRADSYLPGGGLASRTCFASFGLQPSASPSLFSFRPPPGTRTEEVPPPAAHLPLAQAERKAGFRASLPRHLPPGYVLCDEETALVPCRSQGMVIWTVFGNGLNSFSMFQSHCPQAAPARPERQCLCWRQQGFLFTLVGQMERSEMVRIRESVRPR
jgi:hypothetical protein